MAAARSPPSPAQRLVTRTTAAAKIAHQGSRPIERTRSLTPKSAKNGATTSDSSEHLAPIESIELAAQSVHRHQGDDGVVAEALALGGGGDPETDGDAEHDPGGGDRIREAPARGLGLGRVKAEAVGHLY
jgi:hypothetical protein